MILVSHLGGREHWVKCPCRVPVQLRTGFQGVAVFKHRQVKSWVEAMALAVMAHYKERGMVVDDNGSLGAFCLPIAVDAREAALPAPIPARGQHLSPELPASIWTLVRADAARRDVTIGLVLLQICTAYLIRVGLYPEEYRRYAFEREPIAA